MKKLIILYCISAWVGLGACSVYKSYERPDMPVVDSLYRQAAATSADTTSIASLSWRELFTDPKLQALIETGLQNNTDLNIARLKVTEAEATLMTSRLAYLPSISFEPSGTLRSVDGNAMTKSYDIAASASWEVDIFGKLTNAKRGAKAALEQSEAYRQAVQTQLIDTIANSYYSLLMLDAQLDISERTAANWGENVRAMKALKAAGDATELAVAPSEASKLSADASIASLRQQIDQMENTLTALLGIAPQKIDRTTIGEQRFPTELAAGVPLQLLQRRHTKIAVVVDEHALAQAFYAPNAARAAFYPSITLSGSAGWTNAAGAAITNPGQWLFTAVGSLVQPLFNRGKNIANLRIAKAQQEEALLSFRQSLLDAGTDVNNALIQWQTARQRQQIDQQQILSLESTVRSSELLMQYSSQNYLEVLTARQTLLQAELTAVSDRFDEIQGVINLYHALGGGAE